MGNFSERTNELNELTYFMLEQTSYISKSWTSAWNKRTNAWNKPNYELNKLHSWPLGYPESVLWVTWKNNALSHKCQGLSMHNVKHSQCPRNQMMERIFLRGRYQLGQLCAAHFACFLVLPSALVSFAARAGLFWWALIIDHRGPRTGLSLGGWLAGQ